MKRTIQILAIAGLFIASGYCCLAETIMLKDGRKLNGAVGEISGMAEDPRQAARAGAPAVSTILFVDDNLTRRFVPKRRVATITPSDVQAYEVFVFKQPVLRNANKVISKVGPAVRIEPFDPKGVRIYSLQTNSGRLDVIQGITRITPFWTKVEGLKGYDWDMRLATSSIPRETLANVIRSSPSFDAKNLQDRLKVVRLYLQAERYDYAEAELKQLIADFPAASNDYAAPLKELKHLQARQILRELELRQKAGQHQTTYQYLTQFPTDGVSGDILTEVREKLQKYETVQRRIADLRRQLWRHSWEAGQGQTPEGTGLVAAAMTAAAGMNAADGSAGPLALLPLLAAVEQGNPDAELLGRLNPILDEIVAEVDDQALDRFTAYLQLVDDPKMQAQDKLSLAISGWLAGVNDATVTLYLALSMVDTRNLLRQYLGETNEARRLEIVEQIRAQEAGTPQMVAKLLALMAPPVETQAPSAQAPGYYLLSIPAKENEPETRYLVQLPPEYNPHRRYPAIVTLNGAGVMPDAQLDWWAGKKEDNGQRKGQATRHGYIVIAPIWAAPEQTSYGYTAREHAAVLDTLRDAQRRFAIDTDRVFLSGHSMGGDAAWDIGLAHPDLWAGVIPIAALSQKYCTFYVENAASVPFYVVAGDLDGKSVENARDLDRMFKKVFDVTVVEYQGRGHEQVLFGGFSDEVHNIFEWMSHYRRDFHNKDFACKSMRPFDNFFWWLEVGGFPSKVIVGPASWPVPRHTHPLEISGKVTATNGLTVDAGVGQVTLWLSPELLDFNRRASITVNGERKQIDIEPDLALMLEDARRRADRQHPFWAKWETR